MHVIQICRRLSIDLWLLACCHEIYLIKLFMFFIYITPSTRKPSPIRIFRVIRVSVNSAVFCRRRYQQDETTTTVQLSVLAVGSGWVFVNNEDCRRWEFMSQPTLLSMCRNITWTGVSWSVEGNCHCCSLLLLIAPAAIFPQKSSTNY